MKSIIIISIIVNFLIFYCNCENVEKIEDVKKEKAALPLHKPTVVISLLIRNKAHTLPHFLTYLETLNYPKDRINLWIRADHNDDNSIEIINLWLSRVTKEYHEVNYKNDVDNEDYANVSVAFEATNKTIWTSERFNHVIKLKEEALNYARAVWADYIFFLDADVFLLHSNTLKELTDWNLPIIAPMLISETMYSNFWGGISKEYYYQRTEEYTKIMEYQLSGVFKVPMVHSCVLVNLKFENSKYLTFDRRVLKKWIEYDGPLDDIITFAVSAYHSQSPMYITNTALYGYIMIPLPEDDFIVRELQQLTNLKIFILNKFDELYVVPDLEKFVFYPEKDSLTLDKIYMINLKRREEKRLKMEANFKILGLDVDYFEAVDGNELTDEILKEKNIELFPGYIDPYKKRPITMGEIGCFLSHYNIWTEIVEKGLSEVLILEDDILFESYFKSSAETILHEARRTGEEWDFIYLGRKRMEDEVDYVPNTKYLVNVDYSYWTIGYVISLEGAKKLIAGKPLTRLMPVDEYIPIMFDKHPNETLSKAFEKRNLIAWSAAPLLIYPTLYTGDEGYISDTEDSDEIEDSSFIQTDFDENTTAVKKGAKEVLNSTVVGDNDKLSKEFVLDVDTNNGHSEL